MQQNNTPGTAFIIGHIKVKDPEKWAEYCRRVPGTVAPWGGEVIVRGTRTGVLDGRHDYTDTVLIRFPDAQSITGWHESPAYQELIKVRELAADVVVISYQG